MSFTFKQFHIDDSHCGMKVCTDSVLLGAWAPLAPGPWIVDLGAGSGLLSLMCAQRNPEATVTAVEIDPEACRCAAANIAASPWAGRLTLVQADAAAWGPAQKCDLIICNPPYFTSSLVSPTAARAKARHANYSHGQSHSGFGPISVLDFAAKHLQREGVLAMVTPADIEQELIFEGAMRHLSLQRICHVRSSDRKPVTRILTEWTLADVPTVKESIAISSAAYRSLTQDFYL